MKKPVKAFVLSLVVTVLLTTFVGSAAVWGLENGPVSISYDGKLLEFSRADCIVEKDGYFLAPLKELAAKTGWDAKIIKNAPNPDGINLTNDVLDIKIEASIGANTISINGNQSTISGAPEVINKIVMFPVKDFFYAFNCSVKWEKKTRTIIINQPVARVFSDKCIVMRKAAVEPVIDGMDTEDAWGGNGQAGDFSTLFYNEKPQAETKFRVAYDDNALYVFVRCEKKPVPLEGVSLVVAPTNAIGTDTPFYKLLLVPEPQNNLGRTDGLTVQYRTSNEIQIDGYDAQYKINDDSWTAEVKIPFTALKKESGDPVPTASDGTEWRFNVARVRPFTESVSTWVPVRNSLFYDFQDKTDPRFIVDLSFAPITGRSGSIIFGNYADANMSAIAPKNAELRYMGYSTLLFSFNKQNINLKKFSYRAEWIDEQGREGNAEILKTYVKGSKIYFLVNHPSMPDNGLYRLNIYADGSKGSQKYELIFDREQVVSAGVIFNSFTINSSTPSDRTILDPDQPISDAAEKLISVIPQDVGFIYTGNPDRPTDNPPYSLFTYDYVNTPYKMIAKLAGISGQKTTVEKGTGTTPAQYSNNSSVTVTTATGKQVSYDYYQDESGNRYFLDAQLNYLTKQDITNRSNNRIGAVAKTDPLGAAYVIYEIAKAYQDWVPGNDYSWANYPMQWNWGPPYAFFGGMWNYWYQAELDTMRTIYDNYISLKKSTNAFDIVSDQTGTDADDLIVNGMFKKAVDFIKTYPVLNGNYEYKNWMGRISLAKAINEPDYIHETLQLLDNFASPQFLLDGFWKEVTLSYHVQSFSGCNDTVNYLKGWSDPIGYISPRDGRNLRNLDVSSLYPSLGLANKIATTLVYPNGKYYPVQDTWAADPKTAAANLNLGSILLPAANIARMSKGTGASTSQLYLGYEPYYGSHVHYDPLNLSLYSNGQELLPDLGYTHTNYKTWAVSTLGHNTVVVDSSDAKLPGDAGHPGGKLETYADIDETVQIMKADEANAYPGVNEYDREPWYIKMEGSNDSYILDIFRVDGGSRHEYTLNGDANSEQATFTPNVSMTYYNDYLLPVGTEVTMPTSQIDTGSAEGNYYGYIHVRDVNKANLSDGKYEITMSTKDGTTDKAGMKITGFAGSNSELFIGKSLSFRPVRLEGTAADKNNLVEDWYMPKMVVRRDGTDLQSTFVNVMEPYAAGSSAKITTIEKIETADPKDVAVKVTYGNVTDILISSSNPTAPLTVGDITLTGKMAFVRYIDGQVSKVYTVGTDSVVANGENFAGSGIFTGKVIKTMRMANGDTVNAFVVDKAVSDSVVGKTITIKHPDGSVNAFTASNVTSQGDNTIIEVTGGDPGFEFLEDGSSVLRFYPLTKWDGDHTFEIDGETVTSK